MGRRGNLVLVQVDAGAAGWSIQGAKPWGIALDENAAASRLPD